MDKDYAGLLDRLRQRLGPSGMLTETADTDPYCRDWRRLYHGRTPAVLRPANTAEVADAMRLCAEYRAPIVPHGRQHLDGRRRRGRRGRSRRSSSVCRG